jgi:hypothetical protein
MHEKRVGVLRFRGVWRVAAPVVVIVFEIEKKFIFSYNSKKGIVKIFAIIEKKLEESIYTIKSTAIHSIGGEHNVFPAVFIAV